MGARDRWFEDLSPRTDAVLRAHGAQIVRADLVLPRAAQDRPAAEPAPDGVHPSPLGHRLIAYAWLAVVGAGAPAAQRRHYVACRKCVTIGHERMTSSYRGHVIRFMRSLVHGGLAALAVDALLIRGHAGEAYADQLPSPRQGYGSVSGPAAPGATGELTAKERSGDPHPTAVEVSRSRLTPDRCGNSLSPTPTTATTPSRE
ncbi:hypothetical protein ABT025_12395 [Streptomyces sp. NPDC002809]|uniref:hypothetical protein n=1 Tax=Streptomyces sp. NPDC002809 TaxID=3154433 RepID=UPI00333475F9